MTGKDLIKQILDKNLVDSEIVVVPNEVIEDIEQDSVKIIAVDYESDEDMGVLTVDTTFEK